MKDLQTIIKMNEKAVEMHNECQQEKALENILNNLEYDHSIIYRLYIGKNDKDSGKQELNDQYFIDCISMVLSENNIDGFTLIESVGYWKGKPEKTIILEIVVTDFDTIENTIAKSVEMLKKYFRQESIMVTKNHINVAF